LPHEVIITFTNLYQIALLKTIFLKVISNYSQCEQRLYLEIEEAEENVGYLFFFCFSTLYLFAAGGTLMMPFQNGHIIFKKPLVNNFRVAYVDTNCYSPHLPSPQQCTVQGAIHKTRRNILGGEGGLKVRCCKILEGRSEVKQGQNSDMGEGVSKMAKKIPTSFMNGPQSSLLLLTKKKLQSQREKICWYYQ
jgi:hypothetical protein